MRDDTDTAGDQSNWEAVADAFDDLEPLTPDLREAGLLRLKPTVATRVRAMLAGVAQRGMLDEAPPMLTPGVTAVALDPETRVGPFAIIRLIGSGGMGDVYLARRADAAFDQRVALKLLRVDAIASEPLFARERRMLARLEHPGIARLIDGGVTESGRPWMAMAYIDGQPIDKWCATHRPPLSERLRLFHDICEAVAFAHANLVVHRDLKPSNIMIDAAGRVHLLDFGIAKLIEDDDLQTIAPGTALTPSYAAPEQLESGIVTVATDVHALGLILYELLTGAMPWGPSHGTFPTLVRRILNEDPKPPSRIVDNGGIGIASSLLRGDLDAIVLKALRKAPGERYSSVAAMADDVVRYQQARPVKARAGSTRYRLRKYVWRNRWGVAAASGISAALLLGAGGITLQARQTAVERDNALAEARRSDSIVQTLTLMFAQGGYSSDLTMKQTLDTSALRMLTTLDRSARSGSAVNALSDLYVNMQDAKGSYDLLAKALAQRIGADSAEATARMKIKLADAAVALATQDDKEKLLREAQAVFERDPERYGPELQEIIATYAAIARRKRDYDTAIRLLRDSLPDAERALAANDSGLLTRYNNLLVYLIEANRLDEVQPIFAQVDKVLARPGQRDAIQALGLDQLRGAWRLRLDDPVGAERIAASVVDRRRRLFGDTPGLATDLAQLAKTQIALGKFAEARVSLLTARPLAQRYLGTAALPVLMIDLSLAQTQAELGEIGAARSTLTGVKPLVEAMPTPNPLIPQLGMTEAIVELRQGRKPEAAKALAKARDAFEAMGSGGRFGLGAVGKIEARIAALP